MVREEIQRALEEESRHLKEVDFVHDPHAYEEYENFSQIMRMRLGQLAISQTEEDV